MRPTPRLLLLLLLLLAAPALAQDAKPNALTPKELSDGWILLFDGATPYGWAPRGDAKWRVEDGSLTAVPRSGAGMLMTTTEWADYRLKADFWVDDRAN